MSITQKWPVPSQVVLGPLSDFTTWRWLITSPGRTGSWKTTVLSLMIPSGSPRRSLRSKCDCMGRCSAVAPGDQRWGRSHSDRVLRGRILPPVSIPATASFQYSGLPFSVAASVFQP